MNDSFSHLGFIVIQVKYMVAILIYSSCIYRKVRIYIYICWSHLYILMMIFKSCVQLLF